jgi:hypothetical protein
VNKREKESEFLQNKDDHNIFLPSHCRFTIWLHVLLVSRSCDFSRLIASFCHSPSFSMHRSSIRQTNKTIERIGLAHVVCQCNVKLDSRPRSIASRSGIEFASRKGRTWIGSSEKFGWSSRRAICKEWQSVSANPSSTNRDWEQNHLKQCSNLSGLAENPWNHEGGGFPESHDSMHPVRSTVQLNLNVRSPSYRSEISTEKVQNRYKSQYHHGSRIPLLIDEFVIATGYFLVCGYWIKRTNLVPKYFE